MRRNILHVGAANLKYEIREIVAAAQEIEALGREITWENIGDPVHKGEVPPEWIRDIVSDLVRRARVLGLLRHARVFPRSGSSWPSR